jgi:hypothetical protein
MRRSVSCRTSSWTFALAASRSQRSARNSRRASTSRRWTTSSFSAARRAPRAAARSANRAGRATSRRSRAGSSAGKVVSSSTRASQASATRCMRSFAVGRSRTNSSTGSTRAKAYPATSSRVAETARARVRPTSVTCAIPPSRFRSARRATTPMRPSARSGAPSRSSGSRTQRTRAPSSGWEARRERFSALATWTAMRPPGKTIVDRSARSGRSAGRIGWVGSLTPPM